MKGLILNDLLSIRRMLKTLAGIFLVFMVAWAVGGQPATGAMMLCIMGASYILNLFSYDEFYHWEKYLRVLPVFCRDYGWRGIWTRMLRSNGWKI